VNISVDIETHTKAIAAHEVYRIIEDIMPTFPPGSAMAKFTLSIYGGLYMRLAGIEITSAAWRELFSKFGIQDDDLST
jgi:hypothetical protein